MADETPVNVRIERTQPNDDPSDKAKTVPALNYGNATHHSTWGDM